MTRISAAFLCLVLAETAIAAKPLLPKELQGMWAKGSCRDPEYHIWITNNNLLLYGADKRTPVGAWTARKVSKGSNGYTFDSAETNSGRRIRWELAVHKPDRLNVGMTEDGQTVRDELVPCTDNTQ